jgi:SAM (Sterile alpha motif) domain-containing protein
VDVASWLRNLGLERYEAAFRENEVGAEDLCHLTAEDLEGLGVAAIGHRRRLLVQSPSCGTTPPLCGRPDRPTITQCLHLHLLANAASSR